MLPVSVLFGVWPRAMFVGILQNTQTLHENLSMLNKNKRLSVVESKNISCLDNEQKYTQLR